MGRDGPSRIPTDILALIDPCLRPRDLIVIGFLVEHERDDGWCPLSQARLANALGFCRASTVNSLAKLIRRGWVEARTEQLSLEEGSPARIHRALITIENAVAWTRQGMVERRAELGTLGLLLDLWQRLAAAPADGALWRELHAQLLEDPTITAAVAPRRRAAS
jgi:hypothetical protein